MNNYTFVQFRSSTETPNCIRKHKHKDEHKATSTHLPLASTLTCRMGRLTGSSIISAVLYDHDFVYKKVIICVKPS